MSPIEKFAAEDALYKRNRQFFAERLGRKYLFDVVDQWQLYVGIGNLGRTIAVIDLVRSLISVPGHLAEFGCWRGANLMLMAKVLRIFSPHSSKMVLGFDGFEGLQTFSVEDGDAVRLQGQYKGDLSELQMMIELYGFADMVRLIVGDIRKTFPLLAEQESSLSFSLLFCDTDLYEPTKAILEHGWPRLSRGGKVVFDQWNDELYPGETRAVREFLCSLGKEDYRMEDVSFARKPTLVVTKL